MEKIALPKKIEFKAGETGNQGRVIVEPCYPGYGMTIGNALRRVLLSSLSGAAVVGVKIKDAGHEFTTIPHVKEDILEIILNLKKLRVKMHTKEDVKLELDVHGKKEVKAADIAKNSEAEVINGDLTIANITDMAGNLNMEIYVSPGKGYRPVENIEEKKNEIGYIEIDSIFTPVLSVGIEVENVRVGKMTNWDKLILDIKTDGTIKFEDAFNTAVQILIDQFSALVPGAKPESESEEEEEEEEVKDEKVAEDEKDEKKEEKDEEGDKKEDKE